MEEKKDPTITPDNTSGTEKTQSAAEELKEKKSSKKASKHKEEQLNEEIAKLKTELSDFKDRYLRMSAEYDNYRKRTLKEKDLIRRSAIKECVLPLLGVLDTVEGAAGMLKDNGDDAVKNGFAGILSSAAAVFEKLGITEIDALNKEFDPVLHQPMSHIDSDEYGENTVIQVMRKGYMFDGEVLRPAFVIVAN